MRYETPGTLAYYRSAPYFQTWATDIPCADIAPKIAAFKKAHDSGGSPMAHPEQDAVTFYCLNDLAARIVAHFSMCEKLPQWADDVMAAYMDVLMVQSRRLLYYMLLITTREARHLHKMPATWWTGMKNTYGKPYVDFASTISSNESVAMAKFLSSPPSMPVSSYAKALEQTFNTGKWSHSYGGPPWGDVAACLARFLSGETNMETMCDTGYTLEHNTSAMFNKGMLYHGFDSAVLQKILDVQNVGLVPTLVLSGQLPQWSTPALVHHVQAVAEQLPQAVLPAVDWHLVASQSKKGHKYQKEKNAGPVVPAKPPAWLPKGGKITGVFQLNKTESCIQFTRAA